MAKAKVQQSVASIELPPIKTVNPSGGYHVNVHLTPDESAALGALAGALDSDQATLRNDQRIVNRRHAAQWLFERLADSLSEYQQYPRGGG